MVLGSALVVQPWSAQFSASDGLITKAVIWVHFADLSPARYHPKILSALGGLVGRTIKIDIKTHTAERGKFAKVAVEVDLTKSLKGKVVLDGKAYHVGYEGLPQVCVSSGCVNHPVLACPQRSVGTAPPCASAPTSLTSPPSFSGVAAASPRPQSDEFGAWMNVSRPNSRRPRKEQPPTVSTRVTATNQPTFQGSRYATLSGESTDLDEVTAVPLPEPSVVLKSRDIPLSTFGDYIPNDFPKLARVSPKSTSGHNAKETRKDPKGKGLKHSAPVNSSDITLGPLTNTLAPSVSNSGPSPVTTNGPTQQTYTPNYATSTPSGLTPSETHSVVSFNPNLIQWSSLSLLHLATSPYCPLRHLLPWW
ncbi:hypothetical protein Tsubulata_009362 [Turnera subulata]|uniref:DUF4283 domain-containing protein n=1 Tax=Turnera subulata TaxID=218843 RepID=A0A9Q0GD45_9ROSI|nr:hypothetical protein Tsubulata_009362 [Turnera subulata]